MTTWLEQYAMRRASETREVLRELVRQFALREALEDLKHRRVPKAYAVRESQPRLPLEVNR